MVRSKQSKAEKTLEENNLETKLDDHDGLHERLEVQQTRVICGPDVNYHVSLFI